MKAKILEDSAVHKFKIMNGNLTLCGREYRIIGFEEHSFAPDVIQTREVTQDQDKVTCLQCLTILIRKKQKKQANK